MRMLGVLRASARSFSRERDTVDLYSRPVGLLLPDDLVALLVLFLHLLRPAHPSGREAVHRDRRAGSDLSDGDLHAVLSQGADDGIGGLTYVLLRYGALGRVLEKVHWGLGPGLDLELLDGRRCGILLLVDRRLALDGLLLRRLDILGGLLDHRRRSRLIPEPVELGRGDSLRGAVDGLVEGCGLVLLQEFLFRRNRHFFHGRLAVDRLRFSLVGLIRLFFRRGSAARLAGHYREWQRLVIGGGIGLGHGRNGAGRRVGLGGKRGDVAASAVADTGGRWRRRGFLAVMRWTIPPITTPPARTAARDTSLATVGESITRPRTMMPTSLSKPVKEGRPIIALPTPPPSDTSPQG